jgi:hypothetical protein
MSFDPNQCDIPSVWCGKRTRPKTGNGKRYTRNGTPYECMQQGFGAGHYTERNRRLPNNSLLQLKYVTDIHEQRFIEYGINTKNDLLNHLNNLNQSEKRELLEYIFTSNNTLDKKAYNSTLMFLYNQSMQTLPNCSYIE